MPLITCYLNGNSVNTIPRSVRGKIPKEATTDSRPDIGTGSRLFEINMCMMWRWGRTFPRQISVERAVELRKKEGEGFSRNPGHVALRHFCASGMEPGQREPCSTVNDIGWVLYRIRYRTRYVWHNLRYRTLVWPSISYTISKYDIEVYLLDIEVMKPRYWWPWYWCSISKVGDLQYRTMRPSISNTFGIDVRYRTSISNEHTISMSSISKVTFDIEGPTLDIGVARI